MAWRPVAFWRSASVVTGVASDLDLVIATGLKKTAMSALSGFAVFFSLIVLAGAKFAAGSGRHLVGNSVNFSLMFQNRFAGD